MPVDAGYHTNHDRNNTCKSSPCPDSPGAFRFLTSSLRFLASILGIALCLFKCPFERTLDTIFSSHTRFSEVQIRIAQILPAWEGLQAGRSIQIIVRPEFVATQFSKFDPYESIPTFQRVVVIRQIVQWDQQAAEKPRIDQWSSSKQYPFVYVTNMQIETCCDVFRNSSFGVHFYRQNRDN